MEKVFVALANTYPDSNSIYNALADLPRGYHLDRGESRWVVTCKSWDYVLKIPRYGYCNHDYCERELANYQSAVEYGVDRICLPIELAHTTPSGIKIYKQTKYDFDTADGLDGKINYRDYLKQRNVPRGDLITRAVINSCYRGYKLNSYWVARMVQLYGKKFARSFEKWTQANEINDLHDANTGWLHNRPVLLDYAGFDG